MQAVEALGEQPRRRDRWTKKTCTQLPLARCERAPCIVIRVEHWRQAVLLMNAARRSSGDPHDWLS